MDLEEIRFCFSPQVAQDLIRCTADDFVYWDSVLQDVRPLSLREKEAVLKEGWPLSQEKERTEFCLTDLCEAFTMADIPDEQRTQEGIADTKKEFWAGKWRTAFPSEDECKQMRRVLQGSDAWHQNRKKGIGSSDMGALCGWSQYKDIKTMARFHLGEIDKHGIDKEGMFAMDRGHFGEHYASHYLSLAVMGCWHGTTGSIPSKKQMQRYTSPDLLVIYPERAFFNKYTLDDWRKALAEIKFRLFSVFVSLLPIPGGQDFQYLHTGIPPDYLLQTQDQMDICDAQYNDFICLWKTNMKQPLYDAKTKKMNRQLETHQKGVFLVGHETVLRVYRSNEIIRNMRASLKAYIDNVVQKKMPDQKQRKPLGSARMVPLLEIQFLICGSRDTQVEAVEFITKEGKKRKTTRETSSMTHQIGKDEALRRLGPENIERGVDWEGEWPPRLTVAFVSCWHAPVQTVTLQELSK
jgi:hypothetical protein